MVFMASEKEILSLSPQGKPAFHLVAEPWQIIFLTEFSQAPINSRCKDKFPRANSLLKKK